MGWFIRKSLKLGPIRINLSKSGLGASAGIKGLRVGTGPRGRYLNAGREGLYYRTSLSTKSLPDTQDELTHQEIADVEYEQVMESPLEGENEQEARQACETAKRMDRNVATGRTFGRQFFNSLLRGIFGGLTRGR